MGVTGRESEGARDTQSKTTHRGGGQKPKPKQKEMGKETQREMGGGPRQMPTKGEVRKSRKKQPHTHLKKQSKSRTPGPFLEAQGERVLPH